MHASPAFEDLGDCHLQETEHELVVISRTMGVDEWIWKIRKADQVRARRAQWQVINS